jgi:hypothetical protein
MNQNYLTQYRDMYHSHGLITTTLGLNIPVDGRHFYNGEMRVKCIAKLAAAIQQSTRESTSNRRISPLMENVSREAMLLGEQIVCNDNYDDGDCYLSIFIFNAVRSRAWNLKMPIAIILIAISLINVLII